MTPKPRAFGGVTAWRGSGRWRVRRVGGGHGWRGSPWLVLRSAEWEATQWNGPVLAIGSGARAIAGEEDAGRLELVLSYPLRRRDAVLAKGAAVAVEVLVVCAVAGLVLLAFDPLVGLDLSTARLLEALASLVALGLLHGWLALAVGATVPGRAPTPGPPPARRRDRSSLEPSTPMVRSEAPRVKTRRPVSTAPRGAARTSAVLLPVISFSSPR